MVFADPHVTPSATSHQERLGAAIDWVNTHADERQIALVWIVGDVGWSGGLPLVVDQLADLTVTWVPVMGDNEVHSGSEQTFDEVFASQYAALEASMDHWQRGSVEVYDPVLDRDMWLQNFAFDYLGIRWVGLDWISRESGLMGEFAELHDLPDGSLPFFTEQIGAIADGPEENVLLFSHHPMHLVPFDKTELGRITGITGPHGHRVSANYAGHYHFTLEDRVEEGGYDVFVTDALWDDENTIRVVQVFGNGLQFSYEQELVILP